MPDATPWSPLGVWWDGAIDESRHLAGLRLTEERATATTPSRFPQIVHVKPAVVPLKPRVIAVMRRDEEWPPDLALVAVLLVRLLDDLEDATQWSKDVSLAVTRWRAGRAADRRLLREHPDAKEQLDAGSRVLKERGIHRFVRRKHGHQIDAAAYERETCELQVQEMRYVAKRQQMLAIAEREQQDTRRGPHAKAPVLRSVIDDSINDRHWHDCRPRKYDVPTLLLRVEIWRDVREQVRLDDGRVSRAAALAEVLVFNLKTSDPATYKRVDRLRRQYQDEEQENYSAAVVRAVRKLKVAHFGTLEARLSQIRNQEHAGNHIDRRRHRVP